jgi:transposase
VARAIILLKNDLKDAEIREAQIFVATLEPSNYTFAEASLSQQISSRALSHVHAFAFFGGVPAVTTPDNLKSGVTRACRYEPDLNATYRDMAKHYGTVIIPARKSKPRDKAIIKESRIRTFLAVRQRTPGQKPVERLQPDSGSLLRPPPGQTP